MKVEPCRCPVYDPACERAGRPMTRRLWEICANQCPPDRPCKPPNDSESYRRLWDLKAVAGDLLLNPRSNATGCIHLGGQTGQVLSCPTCAGRVSVKVFDCAKHGTTTVQKPATGHVCCAICPDYTTQEPDPFTGPVTRHLLFHLYPRRSNSSWQKNISELLRRIEIFNGRRIVAIVTGDDLIPPNECKRRFHGTVEEFLTLPNDPNFREVQTWVPLWQTLGQDALGNDTITFHAHTKGGQYDINPFHQTNWLWAEMMYESLLDYMPLVEKQLQRFPLVGSFKMLGNNIGSCKYQWHFTGSFLWIRNKHCPEAKWSNIPRVWWGMEAWPGDNFRREESYGVLITHGNIDLYKVDYCKNVAYPALERFRKQNGHLRTPS